MFSMNKDKMQHKHALENLHKLPNYEDEENLPSCAFHNKLK